MENIRVHIPAREVEVGDALCAGVDDDVRVVAVAGRTDARLIVTVTDTRYGRYAVTFRPGSIIDVIR